MPNFGAKILNNAVSAIRAQQAVIATTGNNIANVNTPGYTRRVVKLETAESSREAGGINVGNGVRVGGVQRVADAFLQKLVYDAASEKSSNEVQNQFLSRLEKLFSLTGDRATIGSTLTDFFTAINDLSANPSSLELRTNVIERGEELTSTIQESFKYLAQLQTEADQRIATEIETVNAITAQIADLNQKISVYEVGSNGAVAADERDARDKLLQDLSEKLSFSSVELADGSVTISIANGFPLVAGNTSRQLQVTNQPSFSPGTLPPSLAGGILSYVVYDYNTGSGAPSQIDLTKTLQSGSGTIAGYLQMRGYADPSNTDCFQADGVIVEMASRVEAIARALLTSVNQTYLGPDRDGSTTYHDPSSGDLDGNTPDVFGLFDFEYSGTKDRGLIPDGLPTTTDLADLVATGGVQNFASIIKLNFSDPRRLAAARDASAGPPAAAIYASGDGRNLEALAALSTTTMSLQAGSFSLNATLGEGYNQTVGYVGNLKAASDVAVSVSADNYTTAADRRDQVSGVSLDEEFSGLIQFQKAYEASARMVRIADELLRQIVELI